MSPGRESIAYGRGDLDVPTEMIGWPRLDAPGLPAAPNPVERIAAAAADAAGRAAALAGSGDEVAIVVPDRTRPLPLERFLPPIIRGLADHGVGPERVTVVPASGIHRPMPPDELREWVGEEVVASGVTLSPHDADRRGLSLGVTDSGIPVEAHPACARAGAVIAVSRLVFHYLAGFGGGRKMLAPGVSARKTILAVHGRCLADPPTKGRHPAARTGVLEGNPVHAAACEVAAAFPPTVSVHVSLARSGAIARIDVGDPVSDHAKAARRYGDANTAHADEPFDAVVVSAGGHPVDRDLVQAHKALEAVAPIVRERGSIILVAEGADGVGNPEVVQGLVLGEPDLIEAELRDDFRVGLHTALSLVEKARRFEILAVTRLHPDLLHAAGIAPIGGLDDALVRLRSRFGTSYRAAIAPRGASAFYALSR